MNILKLEDDVLLLLPLMLDCGQTGHYSDSLSSLEVLSGITRPDGPGLAG